MISTLKAVNLMDIYELKKEQVKLASKVIVQDRSIKLKSIAGTYCLPVGDKLLGCVVVLSFPDLELLEKKTFLLDNPLPYKTGFLAYREMPAIIDAFNQLEEEPDIILVNAPGILHLRKVGMASHLGLALNKPTIGVTTNHLIGKIEKGKIMMDGEILGFEVRTRDHSNPVYVSPGHMVSLGSSLSIVQKAIKHPHKMPEPLHLAQRIAKKKAKVSNVTK